MPVFTTPIHEHGEPGQKNYPHGKGGAVTTVCKPGPAGECYRNAMQWQMKHEGSELVHGKVTNIKGKRFDHAWIEQGNEVVDPTVGSAMDKDRWYALTHAKAEARYSRVDTAVNMLRSKHLGPWTADDLDLKKKRKRAA